MKNTVKLNREFTYAYSKGAKIVTGTLVFYWYKNRQSESKLGLTVSTALGGSVVRNRLKRLMRAAYSARKDDIKGGYNIIKIDPAYKPAPIEHKDCFGITFDRIDFHSNFSV